MGRKSDMQARIYETIVRMIQEQGYAPSVREIGEAVGLKSPSTVHFHLKKLEEAGLIEKGACKGRAIAVSGPLQEDRVPVVGHVAAGAPILAQECIEDYITFDTHGRAGEFFALRVRGYSMKNAGILPGDLVAGLPRMELIGDRELRMENHRGILAYGSEEIHISGGKLILKVRGEGLELRSMNAGELLITGQIRAVELD